MSDVRGPYILHLLCIAVLCHIVMGVMIINT